MFYRNNNTHNTGLEVTFSFLLLATAIVLAFFSNYFPTVTPWILLIAILVLVALYFNYQEGIRRWVEDTFILQMPCDSNSLPSRKEHDLRRNLTYPPLVPNAWYHLCDASDLPPGKVIEVRACGKVFVVWRGQDGIPVCQDAYCLHQGANLGIGGKVEDNCLQCPFHFWKFDKDGAVVEIPYNKDPKNVPKFAKLKTYHCVEWCGWVCVYYHADDKPPEYNLPEFVPIELKEGNFQLHLKWNAGFRTTNVIDLVDQVCDHSHFNLLHGEFIIPWTLLPMPSFFKKFFPLGIRHELQTFIGDDKEWKELVEKTGWGCANKYLVFFYDTAGITWNGKLLETTISKTTEMYIGPSLVVFHVPLPIGTVKVFLSFTPVEGGTIIKTRTWIDERMNTYWKRWIAWILAGIAASQLQYDLRIMSNRIRPRKPIIQPTDGPFARINTWLKNFFSEGSQAACSLTQPCAYNNDW